MLGLVLHCSILWWQKRDPGACGVGTVVWRHSLVEKFLPPMEEPVQFGETRRRPYSTLIPKPLLGVNLILQLVGLHGRKIVD